MRTLLHIALAPSFRFRIAMILLLGVGFVCGIAASTFASEMYCGVAAPCEDSPAHTDHHDDGGEPESGDDCCDTDCPDCFFCYNGPLVLLHEQSAVLSLPAVTSLPSADERTLFLPSPPEHQPPRSEKYPAV